MFRAFSTFGLNDLRVVSRDSFLFWAAAMPLIAWIPARLIVPWLTDLLARTQNFDLTTYYPLILIMIPILAIMMLLGLLFGLLVLDERDNATLSALQVTPLSMGAYASYRVTAPAVYGAATAIATLPLVGFIPPHLLLSCAMVVLGSIFIGPILLMSLGGFARNKIEAITIFRALTLFFPATLISYFIPPGWQYLFGVNPAFWPMKALWTYWEGGDGGPFLLVGLLYGGLLSCLLFFQFQRRLRGAG